jgi:hypothetical protein
MKRGVSPVLFMFAASSVLTKRVACRCGEAYPRRRCYKTKRGGNMKTTMFVLALCLTATGAFAQKRSDFSGAWQFNSEKSKNVGMCRK